MNEENSEETNLEEDKEKSSRSSGAAVGFGVLILCIVVTFVFYATGLNLAVSSSGHPHGMPAAPFVGWLIAWVVGWGLMRMMVLATSGRSGGSVKRGPTWAIASIAVLILIIMSGF